MADEQALGAGGMTRPRRLVGRRLLRTAGRENGQSLVEFAMVVPLLLLLVLGIIDFGIAYNYKNDETSLANQALRYAVVNQCQPCALNQPIEDFIKKTADSSALQQGSPGAFGIKPPGVTISICLPRNPDGSQSTGAEGQSIAAVATSDYRWLPLQLPWLPGFLTSTKLTSWAIGRVEPDADYRFNNLPPNAYNSPLSDCPPGVGP
jgi:hypothetical protein